jgi:hypothetical protein
MSKWYINIKNSGKVETVDEFETSKEARKMRREYQLSDSSNLYYLSKRCTKEWREK